MKKEHVVIAGDFNAEIGARREGEDSWVLGEKGYGKRNARGNWLLQWAIKNDFIISNTHKSTNKP